MNYLILFLAFGILTFIIGYLIGNNKKVTKETSFKVDFGRGEETVSWSKMNNLTKKEKDHLLKNAKGCSSLDKIDLGEWDTSSCTDYSIPANERNRKLDLSNWDTSGMSEVRNIKNLNARQIDYILDNNIDINKAFGFVYLTAEEAQAVRDLD